MNQICGRGWTNGKREARERGRFSHDMVNSEKLGGSTGLLQSVGHCPSVSLIIIFTRTYACRYLRRDNASATLVVIISTVVVLTESTCVSRSVLCKFNPSTSQVPQGWTKREV